MPSLGGWLLGPADGMTAGGGQPRWPIAAREIMAGAVASLVSLAHCLSYSALIFSADLAAGLMLGLWSFMIGTTVGCLITAATTSLPPAIAGPRNPAIAVMSVLAALIAADAASAGLSPRSAAMHVLAALTIATLLGAVLMLLLGAFRLGQVVRFIPYPVIAGFLAASGWLLIIGGFKVALGKPLTLVGIGALSLSDLLRLALAAGFVAILLAVRAWGLGSGLLPFAFILSAILITLGLKLAAAETDHWFLAGSSATMAWSPVSLLQEKLDWSILAGAGVEILSVAGVAAIALLLDATSIETQRRTDADLDREFIVGGFANMAIVPLGGFPVALAPNATRLIDELGGRHRIAGLAAGASVGLVLASGINVAGLVPTPVLGGLVVYLGYSVLAEALWKTPARSTRVELGLALVIAAAIVQIGYLAGIVTGLVSACVLFAVRYSRIDAAQRHATRAQINSLVDRDPVNTAHILRSGDRIHIFWLNGFIFFGSANRVLELIRSRLPTAAAASRRWVVLDLGRVSGIDTSAILSFTKLLTWARGANVSVVIANANPQIADEIRRAGVAMRVDALQSFATRGEAIAWCEEQLLAEHRSSQPDDDEKSFHLWLAQELGQDASDRLLRSHVRRRALSAGETLCRQGEPSSSFELIACGSLSVTIRGDGGHDILVRRVTGNTILGEMGFFRGAARAATVTAATASVVYVLDSASYEALTAADPQLAGELLELVVRTLSDRVERANTEIISLT